MNKSIHQHNNHSISLAEAIRITTIYRNEKEIILKPEYADKNILPVCETFERSAFESLLAQEGCVYIRAYFCMDAFKNVKLMFVGANALHEDMLPSAHEEVTGNGYTIQENGYRCPPTCPPPSPVNPPHKR